MGHKKQSNCERSDASVSGGLTSQNKKKTNQNCHACDSSRSARLLLFAVSKEKKIVTGRDVAATWHIAFCNDLRRTHCTNSVGSGDQSVPKALSCLAARLPLSGFKPEGYSSNSQLTHTLTSRALLGIVLRICTAGARRIALARAYQRLLRALPVTPMA